jgi:hypothetical protein
VKAALHPDELALYGSADTVADRMAREIHRLQDGIRGLSTAETLTGEQLRAELERLLIVPDPDTLAAPPRVWPPNTDGH